MTDLEELLPLMVERQASDLHIRVGEPPLLRLNGHLQRIDAAALTAEEIHQITASLLDEERQALFARHWEAQVTCATDQSRFRVNLFREQGGVGIAVRRIPQSIPSLQELMLPPLLHDLSFRHSGLILVTGPSGSGKSTTLAALIEHINSYRCARILSLEDPIEFVHVDKNSVISQRELSRDTPSYPTALRRILRHDSDVIVIGALADPETIRLALNAAETGHLVLSTLPTSDAAQTVDHLIESFLPEQQRQICIQLAGCLQAVISQVLLPRQDIPGRAAAFEVMVMTPAIRTLIREGKTSQIIAEIQTGGQYGMETLDHSLAALVHRKMVRYEDALLVAANPREFEQRVGALNPGRR